MLIQIPISPGELLDRISILELKLERIGQSDSVANVRRELELLSRKGRAVALGAPEVPSLKLALDEVNRTLWEAENRLRALEQRQDFGESFVATARSVYQTNDRRAALKRSINELLHSPLREEKCYASGS